MAQAIHCSNQVEVPPGLHVGTVFKSLREVLNLPDKAIAYVNGQQVTFDYFLEEADYLEFVKEEDGVKGVGQVWTSDQFCQLFQITMQQLDNLVAQGLKVMRLSDGIRITETAADEFIRGTSIDSPYLSTEGAARYCNLTKAAFYGKVERRKITPLPGSGKENRFTREQCDKMMLGERS